MFSQYQHFGISEFFRKEYGENFNFPNHLHHAFELITILSGKMNVTVEEKLYTLYAGDAILIFPHQLHSLSSENCKHMLCIFSADIVKTFYNKISSKIPLNNKFILNSFYFEQLNYFETNSSIIKKKGLLYSICAEFDDGTKYIDNHNNEKSLLSRIFEFVELNYSGECTLKKLSRATGFSYSYISRYFKNIVKTSFNSYVNQYRISNACYILNNSDTSIMQCSLDCGYSSLRSFNRNFKFIIGVAPYEYRYIAKNNLPTPL